MGMLITKSALTMGYLLVFSLRCAFTSNRKALLPLHLSFLFLCLVNFAALAFALIRSSASALLAVETSFYVLSFLTSALYLFYLAGLKKRRYLLPMTALTSVFSVLGLIASVINPAQNPLPRSLLFVGSNMLFLVAVGGYASACALSLAARIYRDAQTRLDFDAMSYRLVRIAFALHTISILLMAFYNLRYEAYLWDASLSGAGTVIVYLLYASLLIARNTTPGAVHRGENGVLLFSACMQCAFSAFSVLSVAFIALR